MQTCSQKQQIPAGSTGWISYPCRIGRSGLLGVRKRKYSCLGWIFVKQKLLGEGHIYKSEGAGKTRERNCRGEDPVQLGVREDGDRNSASTSWERVEEARKALLEPPSAAAPGSDAAALSTCSCFYSRYVYLGILYPSSRPHAESACMLSNSKGGNSCALKLLIWATFQVLQESMHARPDHSSQLCLVWQAAMFSTCHGPSVP